MFNNNQDFYPTPPNLINKMLSHLDFYKIRNVLEPSAGKGDLVEAITQKFKISRSAYYNTNKKTDWDIDTVEIDENLQHILRGKNIRVVHNDFLTYDTYKSYDAIIANFPFSEGDKHLHKALDLQERTGGHIVALINAETIRNPHSNSRKDLIQRLLKHEATIEYIENAFMDAERKTPVTVALIKVNIPKIEHNSIILDELRQQEQHREKASSNSSNIINADFIKGIVEQYNFEVKAGLKLIAEYNAIRPLILNNFKADNYSSEIITLSVKDKDDNSTVENSYIKQVRSKYWKALFSSEQFMGLFTSNLREKYTSKIQELKDYDFSLYNIYTIKIQLNNEMVQGVEQTILALFDEFSHKYHYHPETGNNIHYYNGWKTNSSFKINKKVITILSGFSVWKNNYTLDYGWKVKEKLSDIEKVFNYLDNGHTEEINLEEALKMAQHYGETSKIVTKYFLITFYKKGTCHIEFRNLDLLQKFNLFGSQRKGWIPPCYGKKAYKDMTPEEKEVINNFEGEQSYNNVLKNKDYYIVETSKLLLTAN